MNDLPLFDGIERFAAVRELEVRGANVSRQVFAADRHGVAQAHRIIEIDDGIDRSHLAIAQHPPAQGFRRAGRPLGFCAKGAEYLVPGLQMRLRPLRLAGDNRLAGGAERIGPDHGGAYGGGNDINAQGAKAGSQRGDLRAD